MTAVSDPFRKHFRPVYFHNTTGKRCVLTRDPVDLITARRMLAGRIAARTRRGYTAQDAGAVTLVWGEGRVLRYGAWVEDTDYDHATAVANTVVLDKPPMPEREVAASPSIVSGPLMLMTHKHVARVPVDSPTQVPGYNLFRPLGRHGVCTDTPSTSSTIDLVPLDDLFMPYVN